MAKMSVSDVAFAPLLELVPNEFDETDIVINLIYENVIKQLSKSERCFVISLVLSDVDNNSKRMTRRLISDIAAYSQSSRPLLPWLPQLLELSDISLETVSKSPVLIYKDILRLKFEGRTVNVIVVLAMSRIWKMTEIDFELTKTPFWESNCFRYQQECLIFSFLHVMSSMQLTYVPFERSDFSDKHCLPIFNNLISHVERLFHYGYDQCLLGLLFKDDTLNIKKGLSILKKPPLFTSITLESLENCEIEEQCFVGENLKMSKDMHKFFDRLAFRFNYFFAYVFENCDIAFDKLFVGLMHGHSKRRVRSRLTKPRDMLEEFEEMTRIIGAMQDRRHHCLEAKLPQNKRNLPKQIKCLVPKSEQSFYGLKVVSSKELSIELNPEKQKALFHFIQLVIVKVAKTEANADDKIDEITSFLCFLAGGALKSRIYFSDHIFQTHASCHNGHLLDNICRLILIQSDFILNTIQSFVFTLQKAIDNLNRKKGEKDFKSLNLKQNSKTQGFELGIVQVVKKDEDSCRLTPTYIQVKPLVLGESRNLGNLLPPNQAYEFSEVFVQQTVFDIPDQHVNEKLVESVKRINVKEISIRNIELNLIIKEHISQLLKSTETGMVF